MSLNTHFFIGIPGPSLDLETKRLLKAIQPGGIILFGRNVRFAQQLAKLTKDLRNILGSQLLICLDHEGGRVNRLKDLVGVVPSAMQLGFLGKEAWACTHGKLTGRLLNGFGVNVNLAPVLDLHLKPKTDNSVPDRCWSRNPKEVARLAGAFLAGMQNENVIGCGKHFLGYGAADKDPHLVLPRVTRTRQQILKEDLYPYAHLLPQIKKKKKQGLHLIMMSHAHLKAFHGNRLTPACISPKIAKELLRKTLGFQGVSITDDLEMGAITKTMSIGEATVRCLEMDTDFILICHTAKAIREGFHAAQKALKKERISSDSLEESRLRIENLRNYFEKPPLFSERRYQALLKEIHQFTRKVFKALPEKLRVIDSRWGAIGEKY